MKFLKELCKDDVKYVELGELCEFNKGKIITSKQVIKGVYPVVAGGVKPISYHNEYNREANCITVAASGNAGFISFWDKPIFCSDAFTVDILDKNILDIKYLYYFLKSKQDYIYSKKTGSLIPHIYAKDLKNINIPLPELKVQKKIANILDKFTECVTELQAELQAELRLRIKQYEYYRDEFLTFGDDVAKFNFGQIATVLRGASPRPINRYITTDENGVNWIKIGDVNPSDKYVLKSKEKITIEGASKSRKVKKGDFIISNSMSFGRPYILKIDGCVHDGWLIIKDFEKVLNPDFLYYTLTSSKIQKKLDELVPKGTMRNLNADIIKSLEIFVPPLEKQQEIVEILDKFDTLCNSLAEGLPYEIMLRQKQYEYYRDKLLSFDF